MAAPFRTRGRAVPPGHRSYRTRRAVRVIVLAGDEERRVLMFLDHDPGVPGSGWWVLPGGGIDEGETPRQAAARELAEESGFVAADHQLQGPVVTRVVLHGFSDQVIEQSEEIFLVRVDRAYEVDVSGQTEFERVSVQGHAWRGVDEPSERPVWPAALADWVALTADPAAWPVDLGKVEESVVPVGEGHQGPGARP